MKPVHILGFECVAYQELFSLSGTPDYECPSIPDEIR